MKKILFCALAFLIFSSTLILPAYAKDDTSRDDTLMCAVRYGDCSIYPEGSVEAISAAETTKADFISLTARRCSDGDFIISEDEDVSRMFVNADGSAASGLISEKTMGEIYSLRLREGHGGQSAATEYMPAMLSSVISVCPATMRLIVSADWVHRDEIYNSVVLNDGIDKVIFRFFAKSADIAEWAASKTENVPKCMGGYRGNVIFSAASAVSGAVQGGLFAVELATSNMYSLTFSDSVLSRLGGRSAAYVCASDESSCGKRSDSPSGWDELASMGFTIIETEYPQQLTRYIEQTEELYAELDELFRMVSRSYDASKWSKQSGAALEKALKNAEELLEGHSSASRLSQAYYELSEAEKQLASPNGNEGFSVTGGRIAAAVFGTALVVLGQLYIFVRTKKRDKK